VVVVVAVVVSVDSVVASESKVAGWPFRVGYDSDEGEVAWLLGGVSIKKSLEASSVSSGSKDKGLF
jgi:hypothetical protein